MKTRDLEGAVDMGYVWHWIRIRTHDLFYQKLFYFDHSCIVTYNRLSLTQSFLQARRWNVIECRCWIQVKYIVYSRVACWPARRLQATQVRTASWRLDGWRLQKLYDVLSASDMKFNNMMRSIQAYIYPDDVYIDISLIKLQWDAVDVFGCGSPAAGQWLTTNQVLGADYSNPAVELPN